MSKSSKKNSTGWEESIVSKFQKYITNTALIDLILSFIMMLVIFRIERLNYTEIRFIPVALASLIISLLAAGAIAIFQNDKLPSFVRVLLGYGLLFLSTLVIRNIFGVWIFRRAVALFLFVGVCTLVYFLVVFLISLNHKKEQNDLNQALKKIEPAPEEPKEK